LKPVRKSFNRALYEAYDTKAKDALIKYLIKKGHVLLRTKENYGVDLVSKKHGYTYFNEAEVKVAWKEDWPTHWKEIRIPERKQRLIDKYGVENGVLNFYVFREDLKQAWRIRDFLLTRESLAPAKGRYIKPGELFFHIPYDKAELVEL
jgi:hypothetical protein